MARINIVLPAMGEGVIEATINKWLVSVGKEVREDEPIVEVATDKVDSEVPSPASGTIVEIIAQEGSVPKVGEVIAIIDNFKDYKPAEPEKVEEEIVKVKETIEALKKEEAETEQVSKGMKSRTPSGKFISPLVRNIAVMEGISYQDLDTVTGTGMDGRITRDDILKLLESRKVVPEAETGFKKPAKAKTGKETAGPQVISTSQGDEVIEMDRVRKLGLEDNTLVMVISDHGSPMGNGEHGHGIMRKCRPWPYEELAHIPFVMRGPGLPKAKRIKSFVQSCDVAPTVVDWLGIGVHPSMQGKTLLPLAKSEVESVRDFAIAGYFRYSWSIITEDWSFIHWLKDEEKSIADSRFGIYGRDLAESTAHLLQMKKANAVEDRDTAFYNRAYEEHKKAATLDGDDQWTCTAASSGEVPERDELYDRRTDPFQLKNIASENPEVSRELFDKLRLYMAELRAC